MSFAWELRADTPRPTALFDAIVSRQNTRSVYDGRPVETAALNQLRAMPLEPGVELHFITHRPNLETVLEYVSRGNLAQYADKAFVAELIHWLRFNKKEAAATLDGLFTRATGNPEVPGWLGRMFVAGTKPQQQAESDARKFRSSAGALVVASSSESKAA